MKRPYTPRGDEPIKAWHMRSHAEAIQWLYEQLKPRRVSRQSESSPAALTSTCQFGQIYTYESGSETVTGIRGGLLQCGENNFNVDPQELSLGTDGEWLVQIKLNGISLATDDDDEIFLPGGPTGSTGTPDWDNKAWTEGTEYDETSNPATPTATGELVVPIGKLTIDGGVATLDALGCGRIVVTACGGIMNHTRG